MVLMIERPFQDATMSQVGFLRSRGTTLLRQGDGWIIGDINFQQTSRMNPALPLPQQPLRQNLSKSPKTLGLKLYTALISTHKPYFRSSWATLANCCLQRWVCVVLNCCTRNWASIWNFCLYMDFAGRRKWRDDMIDAHIILQLLIGRILWEGRQNYCVKEREFFKVVEDWKQKWLCRPHLICGGRAVS
jgi:hypothetical protein